MPNGSSSFLDWLAFKAVLTLSKWDWVAIGEQEGWGAMGRPNTDID